MNIQAIVVTYNNEATIERCLESLAMQHIPAIVIDNHSTDRTVSLIAKTTKTSCIVLSENKGFAGAVYEGVQVSSAEYFLFLNPDATLASPHVVSTLSSLIKEFPAAGIFGLLLSNKEGEVEPYSYGKSTSLISLATRKYEHQSVPAKTMPVGWVSGGAMLVKKSIWEKLQGFDQRFFLYWEDVDFCRRAWQAGIEVVLTPSIKVIHGHGQSLHDISEKTRLYDRSADRYIRKHYPFLIWGIYRLSRYLYRTIQPRVS